MRLGVLFSGGKDSTYALFKVRDEAVCLITIVSENKESFMFHTPNIELTKIQSELIGLPLITRTTEGKKEHELKDLKKALKIAKRKYKIEGIVTGAVESVYQASRIQKVCAKLKLYCFNPLWKKNQEELLNEILDSKFKVIITGVFATPLDDKWLGRRIDKETVRKLKELNKSKYEISISGEGGEYESTVLFAPIFKREIEVVESKKEYKNNSGILKLDVK